MTRAIRGACAIAFAAGMRAGGPAGRALAAQGADARQDSAVTAGVRCPERFSPVHDGANGTFRCRRIEVRWVVTTCADSAYAAYQTRPGSDACLPTSLPGVGPAPGLRGSRPVVCAGGVSGYPIVRDRVGDRDRCERTQQTFTAPVPAAAGRAGA